MKYLYIRISTNENKQQFTRQLDYGKTKGISPENIFKDCGSGAKSDRIEFQRLMSILVEGDEIYCSEVSRLTRSLKKLIEIIDMAKSMKLKLVFGETVIDCTKKELDVFTQGQLLMLGLVNEMTRLMIVESVREGIASARARGRIGGQPKLTAERIYDKNPDFAKYYVEFVNKRITFQELCRLSLISRNTAYRYIDVLKKKNC